VSSTAAVLTGVHLAATAAMAGLIWCIQLVHYPLFAAVGPERFVAYEARHRFRISFVVGPLMAVETLAAVVLAVAPPEGLGRALPLIGLALLAVLHTSTVAVQVPLHERLAGGFDPALHRRLVRSNWIRTAVWSARTCLAVSFVVLAR
jgi:hypothetical protein